MYLSYFLRGCCKFCLLSHWSFWLRSCAYSYLHSLHFAALYGAKNSTSMVIETSVAPTIRKKVDQSFLSCSWFGTNSSSIYLLSNCPTLILVTTGTRICDFVKWLPTPQVHGSQFLSLQSPNWQAQWLLECNQYIQSCW